MTGAACLTFAPAEHAVLAFAAQTRVLAPRHRYVEAVEAMSGVGGSLGREGGGTKERPVLVDRCRQRGEDMLARMLTFAASDVFVMKMPRVTVLLCAFRRSCAAIMESVVNMNPGSGLLVPESLPKRHGRFCVVLIRNTQSLNT